MNLGSESGNKKNPFTLFIFAIKTRNKSVSRGNGKSHENKMPRFSGVTT